MECLFLGVIGGMLYQVGVYAYKRFTSKPTNGQAMVIDTLYKAVQKNRGSMRETIRAVRTHAQP